MSLKILNYTIFTIFIALLGYSYPVQLSWIASPSSTTIGYTVYYGTNSKVYNNNLNVGNVTNIILSGFSNSVYYFSSTAYDISGNQSSFSNEAIYTNTSPIYLGMLVNYGDFININTLSIMTYVDSGILGNYYSSELVITNSPVNGNVPNDGYTHTYLCELLQYGNSLFNIQTQVFDLCNFTNPSPFVFYSGLLIETNNPF